MDQFEKDILLRRLKTLENDYDVILTLKNKFIEKEKISNLVGNLDNNLLSLDAKIKELKLILNFLCK